MKSIHNTKKITAMTVIVGAMTAQVMAADTAIVVGGSGASATGHVALAVGANANASGNQGVAIGANSSASGGNATALGLNATATHTDALAIGTKAEATNVNTTVIGAYAVSSGDYGVAVGADSYATGNRSISIGVAINETENKRFGATGDRSISIGNETLASGTHSTAVGDSATATSNRSTSYGAFANATGVQSTAVGHASNAKANHSSAFGDASMASGETSVAVGYGAKAQDAETIAIGSGAQTNDKNARGSIAIGRSSNAQAGLSVAIGADAKTELKSPINIPDFYGATAIGTGASTGGIGSTAIGNQSRANTDIVGGIVNSYSTAVGTSSISQGTYSSAFGTHSKALGHYSISIGMQKDRKEGTAGARGYGSAAIGLYAAANGIQSIALGQESKADKNRSIAIGLSTLADGVDSIAMGTKSMSHASKGVSLGSGATSTIESSVALGALSSTSGQAFTVGYDPTTKVAMDMSTVVKDVTAYEAQKAIIKEANETIDKSNAILRTAEYDRIYGATTEIRNAADTLTAEHRGKIIDAEAKKLEAMQAIKNNFQGASAWESSLGGVSVGNAELGLTRQINNVAAGTLDTDAVNVAQLKRVLNTSINNTMGDIMNQTNRLVNGVRQDVEALRSESREGDAMNAALAALKPVAYKSTEPTQIMAGVGHNSGKTGLALGVAHYTDEGTMFNAGIAFAGEQRSYNGGVTFRIGHGSDDVPQYAPPATIQVLSEELAMEKSNNELQERRIQEQEAKLNRLLEQNDRLQQEVASLKSLLK